LLLGKVAVQGQAQDVLVNLFLYSFYFTGTGQEDQDISFMFSQRPVDSPDRAQDKGFG